MEMRILTAPSQTNAIRAQRLLYRNGIPAKMVRLSPQTTKNGCSWGVRIESLAVSRAIYLLEKDGIAFGEIL